MIFIDSSFLFAYEVADDENHQKAARMAERMAQGEFGTVVTSDYVFDETVTLVMVKMKSLDKARLVGGHMKDAIKILKVDEGAFEKAWDLFRGQRATRFSFTDCTTLAMLQDYRIREIATFDREFKAVKSIEMAD